MANGSFLEKNPDSKRIASLSGYSSEITTVFEVINTIDIEDNKFLVVRDSSQYRKAVGYKAFPDGGVPFHITKDKRDLFLVDTNGTIILRNTYSDNFILNDPYVNTIRRCSGNVIQIARLETKNNNTIFWIHPLASENPVAADYPGGHGVEINLEDLSIKKIDKVEDLCEHEIEPVKNSEQDFYYTCYGPHRFVGKYKSSSPPSKLISGRIGNLPEIQKLYYQFPCFTLIGTSSVKGPFIYPEMNKVPIAPNQDDNITIPL